MFSDAQAKATATYSSAADHYDDPANTFWVRFGRRTIERLELGAGDRVLDVCCGSGASALPAAEAVGPNGLVSGIDLSEPLLNLAREKGVLAISVLDYPGGWRIISPGRTFLPALKARWPNVTALELSDRSTAAERELVAAMAPRFDAVVLGIYVRAASGSGRIDLSPDLVRLVNALGRQASPSRPVVACFFGNPYVAASVNDVPAMLLTYDFGDLAETSAVRVLTGEIRATGRLPITIPGLERQGRQVEERD